MKRKFVVFVATAVSASALFLSSCSKTETSPEVSDTELSVASSESDDDNEVDGGVNDVMNKVSADGSGARIEGDNCTGIWTKDGAVDKSYKISYAGDCFGRTKSGEVVVTLTKGATFKEVGAEWTIVYANVTINNSSKNKKVILNGTHTVTNVSGGNKAGLSVAGSSLVHKIVGNTIATINDTLTRTWQINRTTTWTSSTLTITSDGDVDGFKNCIRTGTNKYGQKFYTQITSPIVFTSACGRKATSGTRVHTVVRPTLGDLVRVQTMSTNSSCDATYAVELENKKTGKKKSKTVTVI